MGVVRRVLPSACLIAACLWALLAGKYPASTVEFLRALLAGPPSDAAADPLATVLWHLRMPRVLGAVLVGAGLAAAGAAYQAMFRNPLVSPDILGVSAGAGLGAVLGIYFGLPLGAVQVLAFLGGSAAVALVYLVSTRVQGYEPTLVLVLAGVALASLLGAGISLIKVLADPYSQLPTITFWLLGGLNAVTFQDVAYALPVLALGLVAMFLLRWRIDLLSLGDEEAVALGVPVARMRMTLVIAATLATAATISFTGIIGWVGLVVPHIARLLVGPAFTRLLPASLLGGGVFLLLADTLARTAASIEIPLGILTSLVGAPFFLFLLARGRRDGGGRP
ncbi:MAG: iron ABC transporter permease [Castellaniella sp.]|uniref:FecCD family ABC transporter permease n=1 Tax=Castellaniella sp. TaxID=1955812 RepID=UPI002A36DFF4|nr:iron ABC transporter permease [Castellaniella sp.]MDY0309634.1 iron ABC transporter permease [Castellaniella sp.]